MKKIAFIGLVLSFGLGFSQTNIKTMFYNVLNYPSAPPSNRSQILESIIDSYEPDIFMICELETEEGGNDILNNSLNDDNTNFSSAPFLTNFSNSDIDLHNLLYYNNQKFELLQSSRISNNIRDINWYTLQFITDPPLDEPVKIEVFVAHLKASQGGQNEDKRLDMVEGFIDNLDNLDPNAYVLFAGDFNLYYSNEPAYQAILNESNPIVMVDPIDRPGSWNSNPSFADIHTQSTRNSSSDFGGYGSGGGVDSRFDFIMVSENVMTPSGLSYIPDTYKSYGNNGNCYNLRIDDIDCDGTYDRTLREDLYNMSDHLPVVMEMQLDISTLSTPDFSASLPSVYLNSTVVDETLVINLQNITTEVKFKVYNSLGQKVKSFTSGTPRVEVPVNDLNTGLYYITTTDVNLEAIKFIKRN